MLFDSLLSVLAPHECLGCTAEGRLLCAACMNSMPLAQARCYRCQRPAAGFVTCSVCRVESALNAVYPVAQYGGAAKDLIWKLKFGRAPAGATEIARVITSKLKLPQKIAAMPTAAVRRLVVTHAPTATVRIRQRGYDQAALIARDLAKDCGLPYRALLRRRGVQEQIGATRTQRAAQLIEAFRAIRPSSIKGAHILLVDDVVTTGATLEAAARTLKAAGAWRVDAVVFAQA